MLKTADACETYCYDQEKVARVQDKLTEFDFQDLSRMFKVLADETRLKIVYALLEAGELCVCDAANVLGSSLAAASHHLRMLRQMGLARYRKEGKLVFYRLDDEHVKQLLEVALAHHKELIAK